MRVWETLGLRVGVCCLRLRYVVPLNHWEREIEKLLCPPSYCIDYVLRGSTPVLGSRLVLNNNLMHNLSA